MSKRFNEQIKRAKTSRNQRNAKYFCYIFFLVCFLELELEKNRL